MREHTNLALALAEWLTEKFVAAESHDGHEPTVTSLRDEARQADDRAKTGKPRALTTHDRKAIDKEFWEAL